VKHCNSQIMVSIIKVTLVVIMLFIYGHKKQKRMSKYRTDEVFSIS